MKFGPVAPGMRVLVSQSPNSFPSGGDFECTHMAVYCHYLPNEAIDLDCISGNAVDFGIGPPNKKSA